MKELDPWVRLVRPRGWIKNFLVFAALLFSGEWHRPELILVSLTVYVGFCSLASTLYIWNDWRDRHRDRLHPRKQDRPLAAGEISGGGALGAGVLMLGLTGGCLALLPPGGRFGVAAVFVGYTGLMVLYNVGLKHLFGLDMLIVAVGVMLRAVAGGVGIGVPLTEWFILCLFFICVLLVAGKRRHELRRLSPEDGREHRPVLGEYSETFLDRLITVVSAAALVTYSMYTIEGGAQFGAPALLPYSIPFVLFGLMRYLHLLYVDRRGGVPESLFLDGPMLVCVLLWVGFILFLF